MATKCAHCGFTANTRSSRYLTEITQEEYFQCSNPVCGHTFRALREHLETLSPSAIPNPHVHLPVANRARLHAIASVLHRSNQLTLDFDS
ncbi:ogr/Delta-like zinc finger family protein [Chitinivorax sp. B]|uniref:ogr/Delta-like zinc finger family protein n=1 Tax=Chitinivorax sp. B TaxID=2502235 RepID=UPI0010F786A9|nr:ogr/Delta-like zinc finger family protein [Chitinivorax sp. B]